MFIHAMIHACTAFKLVCDELQHFPGAGHVVNETTLSLHSSAHKTTLPQVTSSHRRQLRNVIIPVERIQLIEILGQGTYIAFRNCITFA